MVDSELFLSGVEVAAAAAAAAVTAVTEPAGPLSLSGTDSAEADSEAPFSDGDGEDMMELEAMRCAALRVVG